MSLSAYAPYKLMLLGLLSQEHLVGRERRKVNIKTKTKDIVLQQRSPLKLMHCGILMSKKEEEEEEEEEGEEEEEQQQQH